jgi:DNA repair exonuclease SbcCD ATPase subunit
MTAPDTEQTSAAATPDTKKTAKPSLEDTLAALDEADRNFILGEVSTARTEAKNLRERLKAAEPKVAEYERLEAASKTADERAQEALAAADERAAKAVQRVARAEVKAALAGVVDNPDAIVDDLNLAKFVDADGDIDQAAVQALRDKYAGFSGPRAPRPDASQASGANGRTASDPRQEFGAFLQNQLRRQA